MADQPVSAAGDSPVTLLSSFAGAASILSAIAVLYVVAIWPRLVEPWRTPVTISVGVLATVGITLAFIFVKARTIRIFDVLSKAILVLGIIWGASIVAVLFSDNDRTALFKLSAITYFSFLPAWLFLQFLATRGQTIWDEYVTNLYRLRIDHFAHLPEPPRESLFYNVWRSARDVSPRDRVDSSENLYRKKFESLFGPVGGSALLRSEKLSPVALATLLISAGWVVVVNPQSLWHLTILPGGEVVNPAFPAEVFRFAFLGAYFYILQLLVRRYFQNDLKANAYVGAIMRIVVVILLAWVLDIALGPKTPQLPILVFVVGVFPQVGWEVLVQIVKRAFGVFVKSLRVEYPLSEIDGLTIWYESRLLEEGIEDMQNLATCNLVDAMLSTRIPTDRLIDWVDQALLYLHMPQGKSPVRALLRGAGIRTATDLIDVFSGARHDSELAEHLKSALGDDYARLRVTVEAFEDEPNLVHVIAWKSFPGEIVDLPARERRIWKWGIASGDPL